jgi:hypothetical protein
MAYQHDVVEHRGSTIGTEVRNAEHKVVHVLLDRASLSWAVLTLSQTCNPNVHLTTRFDSIPSPEIAHASTALSAWGRPWHRSSALPYPSVARTSHPSSPLVKTKKELIPSLEVSAHRASALTRSSSSQP